MRVPVLNTGTVGLIKDVPGYELPSAAWTDGKNVRFQDGAVKKARGWVKRWTPVVEPFTVFPVLTPAASYWVYAGASAVYATQNDVHYDVSRTVGGAYNANILYRWNGGNLNGVWVFNNFVDVPQYWSPSHANVFEDLPNWPSTDRCRIIRPFKDVLVALNISRSGEQIPNLVKWSAAADVGSIPDSWDITDATKDAGEKPLIDDVDEIRDGVRLRDTFYIYAAESVWGMQAVSDNRVFRFFQVFPRDAGVMATGCVAQFESRHFMVTNDDVKIHDGQQIQSVINNRYRRSLFADIDTSNYDRTFVVTNPPDKEIWICYPESGQTRPNAALVWNYAENTWGHRELPSVNHGAFGVIDSTAQDSWDANANQWDANDNPWSYRAYDVVTFGGVLLGNSSGLYEADSGETKDGTAMHSYIERTGHAMIGPNKTDIFTRKQVLRVYPHLSGTGTVSISLGLQDVINGAVTWTTPYPFVIGTDYKADLSGDGRLLGVRFSSSATSSWKLSSYQVELEVKGGH